MPAWLVDWRPAAQAGLLAIDHSAAARIGAAVRRFAESFERSERAAEGQIVRLRVKGAVALLRLSPTAGTLHVLAVLEA